ncbi:MAG: IS3 family transposase, partial [Spirochaetales bacterium]|nr:IS3 family transposase [Spirochaetales bacterium]
RHLKELGFRQSLSRKGNCWDNACMENFFGLMKSETIRQSKELLSVDGMIKLIDDYIHWYNNQRIQKKTRLPFSC